MRETLKEWKLTIVLGLCIFTVALLLRLYNLTILPVFADEAIYIRWAQVMRNEPTLRFLPLSDGKQPLFMWSVIPFLKFFTDPLLAGRFVSVLTGVNTLIAVFLLSIFLFKSKKIALVASLFYAIVPFSVFFDRMALVDSLLTSFGVWTLFLGILAASFLRLDFALLAGFALGGGLLTKSPALFFALLLPTTILIVDWKRGPGGPKEKIYRFVRIAGLWIVTYVVAYGFFNILRLGPNFQLIAQRNLDYVLPVSHLWTNPRDPLMTHLTELREWHWTFLTPFVFIFLIWGILKGVGKFDKRIFLLSIWAFVPLLIQAEFAKTFTARYLLFSLPPLIIIAAAGFENIAKIIIDKFNLFKREGLVYLTLAWIAIISPLTFDYLILTNPAAADLPRTERSGYLEEWTAGTGIKEVSDFLRGEYLKDRNQKIVVGTEGYFGTLPDGLKMYLNDLYDISVIGVGLDISEVPKSLIDSKDARNNTYLVVNSSRFKGKQENLRLKLISKYPKAQRPIGREWVKHGPFDYLFLFEVTEAK